MEVRLRLQRFGKKKQPYYRVVVVPISKKRDGRFLEIVGLYHPVAKKEENAQVRLNEKSIEKWLKVGAKPTQIVSDLIRKHLKDINITLDDSKEKRDKIKQKRKKRAQYLRERLKRQGKLDDYNKSKRKKREINKLKAEQALKVKSTRADSKKDTTVEKPTEDVKSTVNTDDKASADVTSKPETSKKEETTV